MIFFSFKMSDTAVRVKKLLLGHETRLDPHTTAWIFIVGMKDKGDCEGGVNHGSTVNVRALPRQHILMVFVGTMTLCRICQTS